MRVLLTSTSFQDVPGEHQHFLDTLGFDLTRLRGPLSAQELKPIIASYDAVICGDDEYDEDVIRTGAAGALRYISKYGVGVDRINLVAARHYGVKVANCPAVNQVSVAEHVLALLLSYVRQIPACLQITASGRWERLSGIEISGKRIGIFGLGAVGKEVARKAVALDMTVSVCDTQLDQQLVSEHGYEVAGCLDDLMASTDVLSLHVPLTPQTKGIVSYDRLKHVSSSGLILINTARGGLVENDGIIWALQEGILSGYLADVLDQEPMPSNHPLRDVPGVFITPHVGSRTAECVQRQGIRAIENLVDMINQVDGLVE